MHNTQIHPKIHIIEQCTVFHIQTDIDVLRVDAYVKTGSINETHETIGINHLLEHMISSSFNRCMNRNHNCIQYFKEKGIYVNAFSDENSTSYEIYGLKKKTNVEEMIQYIMNILFEPNLEDWKHFLKREKIAVQNEIIHNMSDPENTLIDTIYKSFFKNEGLKFYSDLNVHKKNVDHITMDMLIQKYKEWYTPDNICLSFIGNMKWSDIHEIIRNKYDYVLKSSNSKLFLDKPLTNYVVKPIKNEIKTKTTKVRNTVLYFVYNTNLTHSVHNDFMFDVVSSYITSRIFNVLRGENELIYNSDATCLKPISTYLYIIKVFCQQKDRRKVIRLYRQLIKHELIRIDSILLSGIKKQMDMKYNQYKHANNMQISKFFDKQILYNKNKNEFKTLEDKNKYINHNCTDKKMKAFHKKIFKHEYLFSLN